MTETLQTTQMKKIENKFTPSEDKNFNSVFQRHSNFNNFRLDLSVKLENV